MTQRERRRQRITNNPRNVRPEELEALLLEAGFLRRGGKGDHVVFTKGQTALSIDYRRPYLLAVYVRSALKAIEKEGTDGEA